MHVELHDSLRSHSGALRGQSLTKACVHCGFCLETCPTYLDSRDERDSPRGRIYLIKQLLESGEAGDSTQLHLDRCLTCRSCETTCPSGMRYGELLDIGRELSEERVRRPWYSRLLRGLLRKGITTAPLLHTGMAVAQWLRPLLPAAVKARIPRRRPAGELPATSHRRKMLLLEGCVQSAATPLTNAAARRVLDQLGIELVSSPRAGCCGALNHHLNAHADGLDDMRRNIDAWWPLIDGQTTEPVEAIVSAASGCGAQLQDYGRLLAHDPDYADRARRVSELCRDLGQIVHAEGPGQLAGHNDTRRVAVHTPCTLQHALGEPDLITTILRDAGFDLTSVADNHLCCGSAGSYSILQPAISERLRQRKLRALQQDSPDVIVTANIGCQLHLDGAAEVPTVHWIELLDTKGAD